MCVCSCLCVSRSVPLQEKWEPLLTPRNFLLNALTWTATGPSPLRPFWQFSANISVLSTAPITQITIMHQCAAQRVCTPLYIHTPTLHILNTHTFIQIRADVTGSMPQIYSLQSKLRTGLLRYLHNPGVAQSLIACICADHRECGGAGYGDAAPGVVGEQLHR